MAPLGWDELARRADPGRPDPLGPDVDTPVLVCGAGPVGLTTALLLARSGVECTVVDRHPGPSLHPKARGLSQRSLEVLDRAGVAEDVVRRQGTAGGAPHRVTVLESLTGAVLTSFPVGVPEGEAAASPWGPALLGQDALEALLVRRCRAEPRVALHFGAALGDVEDRGDAVLAQVVAPVDGRASRVRARWLVACDGARSGVRSALGIPFEGSFDLDTNVNVLFESATLGRLVADRASVAYVVRGAPVPCTLLPVDGRHRWAFHFRVPPGADPAPWTDPDRVRALLDRAVGVGGTAERFVSTVVWSPSAALARHYRRGRVLLAGDAAHVMPPTGAMGANTGLQDADNLAWKLGLVLDGAAGEALVDTYETERRPVGRATVDAALEIFRAPGGLGAPRPVPTEVLRDYRYAAGALVDPDGSGPVGARAPHLAVGAGTGSAPLHRLIGPDLTLLVPAPDPRWDTAARECARTGVAVRIRVAADPTPGGAALLVRPDGVVAWSAAGPAAAGRLPAVLAGLLRGVA